MDVAFPDEFRRRYRQVSDDSESFFQALASPLPRTARVNSLKATVEHVRARFEQYGIPFRPAPWYEHAFTTDDISAAKSIEHFVGAIYIQDFASMLPPLVVKDDLGEAEMVLDACAAPGSKTTQLAALMNNRGTIVANDVEYQRIKALKFNCEKCGVFNTAITNYDLNRFPDQRFDVILLDAPCTSEGTIRKDRRVLTWWGMRHVYSASARQKGLILKSFDLLTDGGVLIYSTCTFAPEENEEVVQYLIENRNARVEAILIPGFKLKPGLCAWREREFDAQLSLTVRVQPQDNDTGGFFMARIRK